MSRRLCFALDLIADPDLIAAYEAAHRPGSVWPEVLDNIRARGVVAMQIWRAFDRLMMVCEVADDFPRSSVEDAVTMRWEEAMAQFQRPLAEASPDEKWTAMQCIFDLGPEPAEARP